MEYRPIPEGRLGTFHRIAMEAFSPQEGPQDPDDEEVPEHARMGEPRGLFEDGDPVSVCKHLWLRARVRGGWHDVAGVSAVATPPEHRRRGLVRRLMRECLAEYRERAVPFAALWPFSHPFYAQFGWATANRVARVECDPDALAFARGATEGRFVRLDADDHGRLDPVYRAHGEPYALALDREEEWWRHRVFGGWRGAPFAYGYERDGELCGYVIYRVDEDDDRRLEVDELAHVDHDARVACLGFLADHDSQVGTVRFHVPPGEAPLDLADDPRELDIGLRAGPMIRLVDVPAALEALDYPAGASGAVVLGVDDPLVDRNDATFRVAIDGGAATVEPTDATPDARIGVGALSQLVVGYRSAGDLATAGDLSVDGRRALGALAAAFPPRDVFLREGF